MSVFIAEMTAGDELPGVSRCGQNDFSAMFSTARAALSCHHVLVCESLCTLAQMKLSSSN